MTELAVRISGQWVAGYPSATWQGIAEADEPLAGVCLTECGDRTEWAKSPRPGALDIRLTCHFCNWTGTNVQFIYFLGGAWVEECVAAVPSRDYIVPMPERATAVTGRLFELTTVPSAPLVRILALFFARRDVKMMRHRIWRLREPLLGGFGPPLRDVLSKGRNGVFTSRQ